MTTSNQRDRRWWTATVGGLAVAYLLGIGAIVVTASLISDGGGSTGSGDGGGSTTAAVSLDEFSITGQLTVSTGDVVLDVTNDGAQAHNVTLASTGAASSDLASGATELVDLGSLEPGKYELFCSIAGHKESGMVTDLVVTEEGNAPTDSASGPLDSHDLGTPEDWANLDESMMASMMEFPAETEGSGNQPLEPVIADDGAWEYELTAEIIDWEIAPGEIVEAWAYNGMVPGPLIKVPVGTHVRINVINKLPGGTDVHWHGVHTPNEMDGVAPYTQDYIKSGDSFVYDFTIDDPATGMYHAHMHGQEAVPNGLFGVFQVGDTPLPRGRTVSGTPIPQDLVVSQEIPMVLNDAGSIGLSLNGKSFPGTEPIVAKNGEWIVIHYFNEGLQIHPMHLHQFPQLVYAKDGIPLDNPHYEDTILVSPGERYSVLVQVDDPGTWVFHCHILNHVERTGEMFGMATAIVVE